MASEKQLNIYIYDNVDPKSIKCISNEVRHLLRSLNSEENELKQEWKRLDNLIIQQTKIMRGGNDNIYHNNNNEDIIIQLILELLVMNRQLDYQPKNYLKHI